MFTSALACMHACFEYNDFSMTLCVHINFVCMLMIYLNLTPAALTIYYNNDDQCLKFLNIIAMAIIETCFYAIILL